MALKTCLGVFSLRDGTVFAALISAVASVIFVQIHADGLVWLSDLDIRNPNKYTAIDAIAWFIPIFSIIYGAIYFIASVLALNGVYKTQAGLLTPFMYLQLVSAIMVLAIFLWIVVDYGFILKIFFYTMDSLVLHLYFFFVVSSYKNSPSFGSIRLEMSNSIP